MSDTTIPSVTYRGPQESILVVGPITRINYTFDATNDFTVVPETWEDFYAMMHIDYDALKRNFVCSEDPKSKQHLRRISQMDGNYEVPADVLDRQAEIDASHARKSLINGYANEYITRVNNDIAYGRIDKIPEDLDVKAQEYAENRINEEENASNSEVIVSNPSEEQSTTTPPEPTLDPTFPVNPEDVTPPVTPEPLTGTQEVPTGNVENVPEPTPEPTPEPVVNSELETPSESNTLPEETPPVSPVPSEEPIPEPVVSKKKSSSK